MDWTCTNCAKVNGGAAHFCGGCGAPNPGEATQAPPPSEPSAPAPQAAPASPKGGGAGTKVLLIAILGVLLIGCCIVAGIVAAVAIPNFLNAKERAKQKRAMADMQVIVSALDAYAGDHGGLYPDTGREETSYYTITDAGRLGEFLVPQYAPALPAADPWEHPFQYGISPGGDSYILICAGSDGETDLEQVPEEPVETHCFEDDILWERDRFLQSPGGNQKRCK